MFNEPHYTETTPFPSLQELKEDEMTAIIKKLSYGKAIAYDLSRI